MTCKDPGIPPTPGAGLQWLQASAKRGITMSSAWKKTKNQYKTWISVISAMKMRLSFIFILATIVISDDLKWFQLI